MAGLQGGGLSERLKETGGARSERLRRRFHGNPAVKKAVEETIFLHLSRKRSLSICRILPLAV